VGDTVKLNTGEFGRVIDIGLRSTKIKTFDNEMIVIPNGQLSNVTITNYAKPILSARLVLPFGVEYGSNPDKVKKVVLSCIKNIKGLKEDKEIFIRFVEMGDFALKFKLYAWVDNYLDRFSLKDDINIAIYKALKKARIGIPFPTRTIYTKRK